jgi:hypothetical protein
MTWMSNMIISIETTSISTNEMSMVAVPLKLHLAH